MGSFLHNHTLFISVLLLWLEKVYCTDITKVCLLTETLVFFKMLSFWIPDMLSGHETEDCICLLQGDPLSDRHLFSFCQNLVLYDGPALGPTIQIMQILLALKKRLWK